MCPDAFLGLGAGKRSNPLLPALYREDTKNQVYISFRNILNNVYND